MEAVPEGLRRLCVLQRDAEKMGTKRKREEARKEGDMGKLKRARYEGGQTRTASVEGSTPTRMDGTYPSKSSLTRQTETPLLPAAVCAHVEVEAVVEEEGRGRWKS
ncbi:hypothetical protein BT69DRAFT_461945 [Atractiella rhizophila]|nr:hypothetical protein BT69DRAFT_461945 [Atractiella rhizophila]